MSNHLLLEIGLEEVPARFVRGAMNQLQERVVKWLGEARIGHGEVRAYATPRRLALLIADVADKQTDIHEEVKGPSRKIAIDAEGNWSKAALGFARSQGVEPEQLFMKELQGVEYVYANKSSLGTNTVDVLPEGLRQQIVAMTFPKNMRWGTQELRFVRPIRWLTALLGSEILALEIAGVSSGNTSKGHRFLGETAVIDSAENYVERLREQQVIVDVREREELILAQIEAMSAERGWHIAVKEDLLEEIVFLVEYPTALYGSFDPSFLEIPQEVLITSMREHQRYFPVMNEQGELLPHFVTVRNGDATSIEQVARGNEKVLRARLSDAKFFYAEDQKLSIEAALAKLESIVYHEELGTMTEKVGRIREVARRLHERLGLDGETAAAIDRAAAIAKFDLVTQMVYEFPELQGIMGEDYARKAGESEAVARAVFEHYQPRFAGEQAPASVPGAIVSLADKIDTIVGCFSIGIIPTGSQDPYALRRQAAGVVQTLIAHGFELQLGDLFDLALDVHGARGMTRDRAEVRGELSEFFALRVKNLLSEHGIRYDVIDAVMAAGFDNLRMTVERASALFAAASGEQKDSFKLAVDAINRVGNLAAKAEQAGTDPALFAEDVERELYAHWQQARPQLAAALAAGDAAEAISRLAALREPITAYFDQVMVMAEDPAVRANRLGLLAEMAAAIRPIADFSKLVW
ncbi:glycine--tRNA ligase subunit beta [Paenibacillus sp. 598K]|uniref:glycine--tRNA ligase subunit beta n=1 Tax=Paenibacillus sp. 598K TaxID=1117987 RepID=UPI000FF9DFC1|nr:glycine--tRNA ligase subunit beta [Paenibacillus sp. 598K]GBF75432.1 glycine--tRNA ligase subunit beta [Paenibacillus sp. 598K]